MFELKLSMFKNRNGVLCSKAVKVLKDITQSEVFIETGTYLGETTQAMAAVFGEVVSIELSEELYASAVKKFSFDKKVTLLQGDSSKKIKEAINIAGNQNTIIWLDAHWSGGNTARASSNTPILGEIGQIKGTAASNTVILIDDIS